MMRPENQRRTRAPNCGAKNDLGPNSMAHNEIEPALTEYFLQAVPRSPYRNRITDPHFTEVVECDALADQVSFETAIKTESELRCHVRAEVVIPRKSGQKRFHAPVRIPGSEMQDTHEITPV
jgi:hypothetical protein